MFELYPPHAPGMYAYRVCINSVRIDASLPFSNSGACVRTNIALEVSSR